MGWVHGMNEAGSSTSAVARRYLALALEPEPELEPVVAATAAAVGVQTAVEG